MGRLENIYESLWKLSPQKIFHYLTSSPVQRMRNRELKRISDMPRFVKGTANLSNYSIAFNDPASFMYQYNEIFVKENYKFTAISSAPLIYDCGANIGLSVLYFKALYPEAKIKAFEPDPEIVKILENNISCNELENIAIENKAAWNENGVISFGCNGSDGGSIYGRNNIISVESVRLKDLIEAESFIDLLKLDVEGAEIAIIVDCKEVLNRVDKIFIEYHSFCEMKQNLDALLSVLSESGYRYFLQPISESSSPFVSHRNAEMDLQLNIYAVR